MGLGYTRIISEYYGLQTAVTIFVPTGQHCVVQSIEVTNMEEMIQTVDAIPVVEYTHPDALKQFTNADWIPQTMRSKAVIEPDGRCMLVQYPFMNRDSKINYFTSNKPVASFDSDRKRFLGDNEYGTWAAPLSLLQPELNNSEALRGIISPPCCIIWVRSCRDKRCG